MIKGHGNYNSPVMLIGDGGGPECASSGYALSGFTSEELSRLAGRNFDVGRAYKTLLVKERINASDIDSYKNKVDQYWPILQEEIKEIGPNLIIPINELIFQKLTHMNGIRKFRGSVLMSRGLEKPTKVLPILGPNPFLNQEYKLRWVTQIDFQKVPKYAASDTPPEEQTKNIWIAKTASSLRNFLDRSYRDDGKLVFDIEAYFGIPICISFCFDGNESVCVPFLDKSIDFDNRVLMVSMVSKLLASPIRKVNQNIKFDLKRLRRFGFHVENISGDTIIAASLLTPELPKNLGFLTSIYTEIPYFKDEGKQVHLEYGKQNRDTYYLYNAKDSLATWQIDDKQSKELNEVGSRELYDGIVRLIPKYNLMEEHGIYIDQEESFRLLCKYETVYGIQLAKLHRLTNNYKFNPQSPKQVSTLIFEELGYIKGRRVKGTDEDSLNQLMVFGTATKSPIYGKQILMLIIDCRKIHKIIEYLRTACYPDGTWKTEYNLAGTETGRSSAGGEKKIAGTDQLFQVLPNGKVEIVDLGRSFQTIAKHGFVIDGETLGREIRKIFVPCKNYSFVEIDMSQAEARVDAVLAGNFEILTVFDGPIGIHKLTGSWIYDCPPNEIKKNTQVVDPKTGLASDRYHMAKTARHSAERNITAEGMVMMTQKPIQECKRILEAVHGKQPEIREVYHKDVRHAIDSTRVLVSPHGRVRQFLDRKGDHFQYNSAISQLPQCIVSDQLKLSLNPTFDEVGSWAILINEAHDGTLAMVPKGREMEYGRVYRKNIETPIDFRKCNLAREFDLVIPTEIAVSDENWFSLKDVKWD